MNTATLNLARKWRPKNFDEMVGQELSTRILKNSLYKAHYFPVYLFSGQRGCGKTTAARLFAAAINCDFLSEFQEKPQATLLPCGRCTSCVLMLAGSHPDFIEIDAASHTGVEHVRTLIDSAALLPTLGRKRVYLIDEAHMLSKAAFNAFLKTLEEPPKTTLFIFATTDVQKIIETVRSRCFQLFFTPVDRPSLVTYLTAVCAKEEITCEKQALELIATQVQGCVRDALNLLEQARFSGGTVTKSLVNNLLGYLSHEHVVMLAEIVLQKTPADLFACFERVSFKNVQIDRFWIQLMELVKQLMLIKNNVEAVSLTASKAVVKLAHNVSRAQLQNLFEELLALHALLIRIADQHMVCELMLLKICERNGNLPEDNQGTPIAPASLSPITDEEEEDEDEEDLEEDDEEEEIIDEGKTITNPLELRIVHHDKNVDERWGLFLNKIQHIDDRLIVSVFTHAVEARHNQDTVSLVVVFPQNFAFFEEILQQTRATWITFLQELYGKSVIFIAEFTAPSSSMKQSSPTTQERKTITPVQSMQPTVVGTDDVPTKQNVSKKSYTSFTKAPFTSKSLPQGKVLKTPVDIQMWPKTALVLHYFPGTVHIKDVRN
jgi:DNA polymerase III subunit gamma/tau